MRPRGVRPNIGFRQGPAGPSDPIPRRQGSRTRRHDHLHPVPEPEVARRRVLLPERRVQSEEQGLRPPGFVEHARQTHDRSRVPQRGGGSQDAERGDQARSAARKQTRVGRVPGRGGVPRHRRSNGRGDRRVHQELRPHGERAHGHLQDGHRPRRRGVAGSEGDRRQRGPGGGFLHDPDHPRRANGDPHGDDRRASRRLSPKPPAVGDHDDPGHHGGGARSRRGVAARRGRRLRGRARRATPVVEHRRTRNDRGSASTRRATQTSSSSSSSRKNRASRFPIFHA
mmetsp:Transcript_18387/g.42418  ORF Transcript_18387/g.42418 Transcript_18387/m.42418 type:complete len:284 (-) Transcript_18387:75-926(-)